MNLLAHQPPAPADTSSTRHQLPPLPYAHDALGAAIDTRTMTLHHDVHHAGYVKQLNTALAGLDEFAERSAHWLLCHLDEVPRARRAAVHHGAGGHVNHSLFWRSMKAGPAGKPLGPLRDALCRAFGSVPAFRTRFEEAGAGCFGSGWVWLVLPRTASGKLEIMTTAGHDHPAMKGRVPLLLNDVWEHAYYLRYESRRPDYLKAWWAVVDWDEVGRRYEDPDYAPPE